MREVTVLGSGVIGLTSALVLLERGFRARVVARDFAWRTTSAVAAAIWFPYEARPPERVNAWARHSYDAFARLAHRPGAGVAMTQGVIYARTHDGPRWWRELMPAWQPAPASDLPRGVVAGDVLTVPVAEMPIYLQYLVGEIQRLGGHLEQRTVQAIDDLDAPALVNCTGLGARTLAADPSVYPIRGQIVCTERAVDGFVIDDDNPAGITYIVPRAHDCVLGGTAQAHVDDERARDDETRAIHARCADLRPALASASIREVKVGLRPGRPTVRLDAEHTPGKRLIVHNYGHGGAGMTLSWGCAAEVAALLGA